MHLARELRNEEKPTATFLRETAEVKVLKEGNKYFLDSFLCIKPAAQRQAITEEWTADSAKSLIPSCSIWDGFGSSIMVDGQL